MKYLPYLLKTLWRHRVRTMLTVSGSAVALFVFCFVGAIQEGLDRLTRDQQNQRTLIVFQANRFCPFTSSLPEDYERRIARVPGVRNVFPIKVYTNNCRASLDVIVFHGIRPQQLRQARNLRLAEGDWGSFERHRDAALVGRNVARRRGLEVGKRFSIGVVTVTVAGIFEADSAAEEDFIYTDLEFLQRIRGQNSVGLVTQFEVQLAEGAEPADVAAAIDQAFRGGSVATDTRPKGVFQANSVGDLAELIGFARYLGFACVGLVLVLVATTTLMAVQDRVREHAVLQTIGFSMFRVFSLVLTESVLLSLAGGLLGVGLALAALTLSRLSIGAEAVTIAFTPSVRLAAVGAAVSLLVGLLAGLLPAWQAARAEIVPALRAV
jgi:putative ABC transport system permease protein